MRKKPSIFLSYAIEDQERVNGLHNQLKRSGYEPWMDTRKLGGGVRWQQSIRKAIKDSDLVCVCLSSHTFSRDRFVIREIRYALFLEQERNDSHRWDCIVAGKKIEDLVFVVPLRMDDCEIPEILAHNQYIDLFEPTGWRKLLKTLREIKKTIES